MKALTVHQPWAWAIIHAGKDVENRSWHWQQGIGSELAIHAGKSYDWAEEGFIEGLGHKVPAKLPMGAIVGLVTITGIHHATRCRQEALPRNTYCSPWAVGLQYHWQLSNPRPIEPVACRGAQGIWAIPDEIAARVAEVVAS